MIKIADNLSLPTDVVTQTAAILAKRRAGKSYAARRFAEQLFGAGQQIVIVDPKGDWWGIRSSADGRTPGLPVIILGGEHGDVPLESNSGEIVAKLIVEERVSVLVDLSFFRKHEVATFMANFLETFYRLKAKEQFRTPVMLIIDEADAIAPQRPQKGEERMLGAAEDIVRRGGQRGIGCLLVTQRSAVLNKNVLTQSQIIVALRTIAPQDIAALDAWIDVHGTVEERKTLLESISSLPVGDAWFWSPGWPHENGIFKRVHVLQIATFDSGATPKPGEKRVQPKNLADIDLDALKRQMAATLEKAKAQDPRELRRRISELENEIKRRSETRTETKEIKVNVLKDGQIAKLEAVFERIIKEAERHGKAMSTFWGRINEVSDELLKALRAVTYAPSSRGEKFFAPVAAEAHPAILQRPLPQAPTHRPNGTAGDLPVGEKKVLTAVLQYGSVQRDQLSVLIGYRRSSRDAYIQRLLQKGFLRLGHAGIESTAEGAAALRNVEPLPTGEELQNYWLARLPIGERKILEAALGAYPQPIDRDALSEIAEYKRSSRDAYIQRLQARRLIEPVGRGQVKASDMLFE